MQRLIIHLLVTTATFFIGITSQLLLNPQHTIHLPKTEAVRLVRQSADEPPVKVRSVLPSPNLIFDYDPKEFNPRGDYYLIGRKPKEFREFDCLELAVDEINGKAYGRVMIQTYEKQMYSSHYTVSGLITRERLTFVTTPVAEDDFEYSFDGKFLRKGVLSSARKYVAVLQGKLKKSKEGIRIAESTVRFRVEFLGC